MSTKGQDLKNVYKAAYRFLIKALIDELGRSDAKAIADSYLNLQDKSDEPKSLQEIFLRILKSAQNANMKHAVIGKSIDGGVEGLGKVLFKFDHEKVSQKFAGNPDKLMQLIESKLKPRGKKRKETNSIWPKYCETILSSAEFLKKFSDGSDFYEWANHFYKDPRSMAALPMILSQEIEGIGYALACDFLKEAGFVDYGKPDVHIKRIFEGIGLCPIKSSDYAVQMVIAKIADAVGVSAYNVDKLFWLIGSGKFYNHNGIPVHHRGNEFIAFVKQNKNRKAKRSV
jgi:hypothetical protein